MTKLKTGREGKGSNVGPRYWGVENPEKNFLLYFHSTYLSKAWLCAKLLPWKQNSLLFSHNYISQLVNFTQALGLYPQVLGELRYGKYTLKEKCLCQLPHLAHWPSKTLVSQDSTEWEELDAFQGYFNKPMLFLLAFRYRIMPDTLDSHHWAHEDTLTDSNSPF